MNESSEADREIETILNDVAFDVEGVFLTQRQALVLAMRERGDDQGEIADRLECSRANVSNIERSARNNIEKARDTLTFAELLSAPIQVELPADLPLHRAAERIFEACDAYDVKVNYGAPELSRKIAAESAQSEEAGKLGEAVIVKVTAGGDVHVLRDPNQQ